VFKRILLVSDLNGCDVYVCKNAPSAAKGFNELLKKMPSGVSIICHQDIYFPPGAIETLKLSLKELPDSWVVAGPYGINELYEHCGKIHDRRVPLPMDTGHGLPRKAVSIDGCCMVLNESAFEFDESMEGFDLYDVYATLRARELGTAWIIDFPVEHYATRPWSWTPTPLFMEGWAYLKKRFPLERIVSTCYQD
jgi:hypothetical protein